MRGLIFSANPLFVEVISQALNRFFSDGYVLVHPDDNIEGRDVKAPELIIIDESMPPALLTKTLGSALQIKNSPILVVNPESNDCLVVKSYISTITNLEDFMSMIVTETEKDSAVAPVGEYQPRQEDAEVRAELYHFLASILNLRPDIELVRKLRFIEITSFATILEEEDIGPDLEAGISLMAAFIQESTGKLETQVEEDLAVDWTRLFRGVQPGYGPPPPYEAEYLSVKRDPSQLLQRLAHEYAVNEAKISSCSNNRGDYLGLELAFLSFLATREAEAWKAGQANQAQTLASTAQEFVSNHPGVWVGKYCDKALPEARTDFYRGFLLILRSMFSNQKGH